MVGTMQIHLIYKKLRSLVGYIQGTCGRAARKHMVDVATMFLRKSSTMCMGLSLVFDCWLLGTNWEHKITLLQCIAAHGPAVFLMQVRFF